MTAEGATDIHVTRHAAERYIERVDATLSLEDAAVRIREAAPIIRLAAAFGCRCVRLGHGAKLVLSGLTVITVLERRQLGGWRPAGDYSDVRPTE